MSAGAGRRGGMARIAVAAGLIALLAAGLAHRFDRRHGFTGLAQMGETFYERATPAARAVDFAVASQGGYDGEQYVQIALDPLLRDRESLIRALDNPSYRAKRIVLPALAWVAGLGHPAWIVTAYCLLNVVFWLGLLALLWRAFPQATPETAAVFVGILLSLGALESVRRALADLPAAFFLALAISARGAGAPLAWGCAVLTREVSILDAPVLWRPAGGRGRAFWIALAAALGAIALWFGYVVLRFPGHMGSASQFSWPFQGMGERLAAISREGGWGSSKNLALAAAAVAFSTQAAYLVRHPRPASPAWRMAIVLVALYPCLGPAIWVEAAAVARIMLPLTIAFHWELASRRGPAFWAWWIPGNLTLWYGVEKFLFGA